MSAATQNEMERLRKERDKAINDRDTARRDYEVMNNIREGVEQDLEAALEREQALVAHVEHLDNLRRNVILAVKDDSLEYLDISVYRDDMQPNKPTAAYYTKRDLIKQAEALEGMADENFISSDSLYERAFELRQQAEAQDD